MEYTKLLLLRQFDIEILACLWNILWIFYVVNHQMTSVLHRESDNWELCRHGKSPNQRLRIDINN